MDEVLLQKLAMAARVGGERGKVVEEVVDHMGKESIIEGMDMLTMPWSPYSRLGSEADHMWETFGQEEEEGNEEEQLEVETESEGEATHDGSEGREVEQEEREGTEDGEEPQERDNVRAYKGFVEYARRRQNEGIALNRDERGSASLLHLLLRKKASLDTYEEVMRWHLEQRGLLREHEAIGMSPNFITREKLLKDLRKRYYMDHQYAKRTKVFLPHSKCEVTVWRKEARDNVLSLLTDPRWTDDDWLFPGEDPLAPPAPRAPIF